MAITADMAGAVAKTKAQNLKVQEQSGISGSPLLRDMAAPLIPSVMSRTIKFCCIFQTADGLS